MDTAGIGFEASINVPFFSASVSIGLASDDKGNTAALLSGGGGFQLDKGTIAAARNVLTAGSLSGTVKAIGGLAKAVGGDFSKNPTKALKDSGSLTFTQTKSNADTVQGLGGPFTNTTVQGGVGVGGGRTTFSGTDSTTGKTVTGTTYSEGLVAGVSASKTVTGTAVGTLPKNPNPKPPQCMHNPQAGGC